MKHIIKNSKGFTLIELLVVIAIIAILAVAVILTLNPAELLKQARDSTRVSDLSTLKSAISLYLADVSSPNVSSSCSISVVSSTNLGFGPPGTCGRYNQSSTPSQQSGTFGVSGNGWVPINFNSLSSGAPISNIPRDPSNSTGTATSPAVLYYSYSASNTSTVFELDATMESTKYSANGGSDVVTTDGGSSLTLYEVGTYLSQ